MKFGTGSSQVEVNFATRTALFRELKARLQQRRGFALATLNLDHLTKLPVDKGFAQAYRAQDIVVADGRPVVWLSQLARRPVELMPGSDLILPICDLAAEMDAAIALVGSSDDALQGAAAALKQRTPGLRVTYIHAPAYGFDPKGPAADDILEALTQSGAALCFIALGAPKQEVFAARGRAQAPDVGFVSIGAGLDFLSGHQVRAPKIMRKLALEWLWRAGQSPRRMVPRYAKCFAILPGLVVQALRQR
ncbi:MAG: WecB/TagA/CpsF family glycosyltransferase [Sulfitobacter sp.]